MAKKVMPAASEIPGSEERVELWYKVITAQQEIKQIGKEIPQLPKGYQQLQTLRRKRLELRIQEFTLEISHHLEAALGPFKLSRRAIKLFAPEVHKVESAQAILRLTKEVQRKTATVILKLPTDSVRK